MGKAKERRSKKEKPKKESSMKEERKALKRLLTKKEAEIKRFEARKKKFEERKEKHLSIIHDLDCSISFMREPLEEYGEKVFYSNLHNHLLFSKRLKTNGQVLHFLQDDYFSPSLPMDILTMITSDIESIDDAIALCLTNSYHAKYLWTSDFKNLLKNAWDYVVAVLKNKVSTDVYNNGLQMVKEYGPRSLRIMEDVITKNTVSAYDNVKDDSDDDDDSSDVDEDQNVRDTQVDFVYFVLSDQKEEIITTSVHKLTEFLSQFTALKGDLLITPITKAPPLALRRTYELDVDHLTSLPFSKVKTRKFTLSSYKTLFSRSYVLKENQLLTIGQYLRKELPQSSYIRFFNIKLDNTCLFPRLASLNRIAQYDTSFSFTDVEMRSFLHYQLINNKRLIQL